MSLHISNTQPANLDLASRRGATAKSGSLNKMFTLPACIFPATISSAPLPSTSYQQKHPPQRLLTVKSKQILPKEFVQPSWVLSKDSHGRYETSDPYSVR